MTTDVEICNLALQLLGNYSIESLDEDSAPASACNTCYETLRDQLLQEANWNFASKTAVLTRVKALPGTPEGSVSTETSWSTTFPPPPWNYEYSLPDDYLKAQWVIPQSNFLQLYNAMTLGLQPPFESLGVPFKIVSDTVEGTVLTRLVTNAPGALLVYTYKVETTTLYTPKFIQTLAAMIAGQICMFVTGDARLAVLAKQNAEKEKAEAKAMDGNEGLTIIDIPVEWISARSSPTADLHLIGAWPWPL